MTGSPGAIIAIQTFGDFLGFNPHCHVLITDGCFYKSGARVERIFSMTSFRIPRFHFLAALADP